MDLSHWDAVTFFSRDQIVYLLAGVDPNDGRYPSAIESKVKLYRELVGNAIDNALLHAWEHVIKLTEPPAVFAPDIFSYDPWEDELPSYEIRCSVANVLRDPANVPILLLSDPWYSEKFQRDDVHAWVTSKGLNKGYRFDRIANDRIPGDISHSSSQPESFLEQLEPRFEAQLKSEMIGVFERGDPDQSGEGLLVQNARAAANARHSKPGGSRDKRQQIRDIWSSGKYRSRDICAEQECAALGVSFSSARKALRGTPDPT